jgi:hypothetical protein
MLQTAEGQLAQPVVPTPARPNTLRRDDSESFDSARAKESQEKILQTKLIVVELLQVIFFFKRTVLFVSKYQQIILTKCLVYNGCSSRLPHHNCSLILQKQISVQRRWGIEFKSDNYRTHNQ